MFIIFTLTCYSLKLILASVHSSVTIDDLFEDMCSNKWIGEVLILPIKVKLDKISDLIVVHELRKPFHTDSVESRYVK